MKAKSTKFKAIILIATVSIFLTNCRKDISIPAPECEKLFGTWEWVESSGGISGNIRTPTSDGYTITREFNKNGIYKWYKNGKRQDKMEFSITESSSAFTTKPVFSISYKDIGLFDKKDAPPPSLVEFIGQDTLFFRGDCPDCLSSVYIRK